MSLTQLRLASAIRKIERAPYTPYQRHRMEPDPLFHPWRVFVRLSGAGYEWTICDTNPNLFSSYPTNAIAGKIINPNGLRSGVAASGWTYESSGVTLYLTMDISGGSISGGLTNTASSGSFPFTNPAVIKYPLADITFTDGIATVSQRHFDDMSFLGTVIPAWYSGYNTTRYQYFLHKNTAAPEWVTAKDCSGTEISGA